MKIRKAKKISLALAGAVMAASAGTAHADKNSFKSFESLQSPFNSCKDVKIITEDEYNSDSRWQKEVQNCGGMLQIAPNTGFTVASMKENAQALMLMGMVAEATKKRLETNLATMTQLRSCFANSSGKDCAKTKADALAKMKSALNDLNREAIVARELINGGASPMGRRSALAGYFADGTGVDFAKASGMDANMTQIPAEVSQAIDAQLSSERKEAKGKKAELQKRHQEHRAKTHDIMLNQMPLLSVLPKTKNFKDGIPQWSDAEIVKAFDKLIENAKGEIAKTQKSIDNPKLEFARFYETKKLANGKEVTAINMDRLWKSWVKGERDLLDYIVFTPVVDEVLKSRPDLCATATGLAGHISNKQAQNMTGIVAGAVATLGAGGAFGAAAAGAASGGAVALTGGEVAALLGIGMGMGNVAYSFSEVSAATREGFTYSGAGANDTKGLQDNKRIEEARKGVVLAVATHPLDYLGTGAAGAAIYRGLKEGAITSKAAAALKGVKAGSKEETQIINDAISEVYFKGRTPAEAEKRILAEINEISEKRGMLSDKLNRQVELAAKTFENPVKTQQEIAAANAAKALFANLDPAIVKEWDDAGFQGFKKVYGEVLADTRKMKPRDLAKFETDSVAQENVFRRALRKMGVKDKGEEDAMVRCVLPTRAAK